MTGTLALGISPVMVRPGTGFSPAGLAGLQGWFRADAGVYADAGSTPAGNGDPVQEWQDQSGQGNDATEATAGDRPVFRTSQVNGYPAVDFNIAADTRLGLDSSMGLDRFHLFYVARFDTVEGAILSGDVGSKAIIVVVSTTAIRARDDGGTFPAGTITGAPFSTGTWYLLEEEYDAGTRTVRRDGTTLLTETRAGETFTFGRVGNNPTPDGRLRGDLAEMLLYDRELSVADAAQVRLYLNDKYGL